MSAANPYGLTGQVLDGQFRVEKAIGEGGFSVVFKGHHLGLDEPVAIKCLKLGQQLGSAVVETFMRRFRDESRLQYKLSKGSLYITRTIAAGTTIAPTTNALVPYMVMEWLDGFTLRSELDARRGRGEKGRSLDEVVKLLNPVADAMAHAHNQGVVHRDLNPGNLFCQAQESGNGFKLKVMDFGVAKVMNDHALAMGPRAATMGQIRMFTPAYAAPEQFDETLGLVSPATDVYSFAMIVVELLGDRAPVDGDHLGDFLESATNEEIRPTPRQLGIEVGDGVERVLGQALSVSPKDRPTDIGVFWGHFKHALRKDREIQSRRSQTGGKSSVASGRRTKKGTLILPESDKKDLPEGTPGAKDSGAFRRDIAATIQASLGSTPDATDTPSFIDNITANPPPAQGAHSVVSAGASQSQALDQTVGFGSNAPASPLAQTVAPNSVDAIFDQARQDAIARAQSTAPGPMPPPATRGSSPDLAGGFAPTDPPPAGDPQKSDRDSIAGMGRPKAPLPMETSDNAKKSSKTTMVLLVVLVVVSIGAGLAAKLLL